MNDAEPHDTAAAQPVPPEVPPAPVSLGRRATAEGVGTGLLVAIVVGSGIAAERLSPDDTGLQLLENSLATALGLAALILAFAAVSGAHLNPVVTLAQRLTGSISTRDAGVYATAQVVGGCAGAVVANIMYGLDPVHLATATRTGAGLWTGEVVATFGLVLWSSAPAFVVAQVVGGLLAVALARFLYLDRTPDDGPETVEVGA